MPWPKHPSFKIAYGYDPETGQYTDVVMAQISPPESTGETPVYLLPANATYHPVPSLAAKGKDWQWTTDKWRLVDDFSETPIFDKATGGRIQPPPFGSKLAKSMTDKAPAPGDGFATYWDDKADKWAYVPATIDVYCFDEQGAYTDASKAVLKSIAPKIEYDLQSNATTKAPPDLINGQWPKWGAHKQAWSLVSDYRKIHVWDKASAQPVSILFGEEPAETQTLVPPPNSEGMVDVWNNQTNAWDSHPNLAGTKVYDTKTQAEIILTLSDKDIPEHATTLPPPSTDHHFESGAWGFISRKTSLSCASVINSSKTASFGKSHSICR